MEDLEGNRPEGWVEVEPQLPIIQHKSYLEFDDKRSRWDVTSEEEKSRVVENATNLIKEQTEWWKDRPSKSHNNSYSWTNVNVISAAMVLEKSGQLESGKKYIEEARDRFYEQVRENTWSDGSSLDYHERDSIHYQVFNEVAWLKTAGYLRERGEEIPEEVEKRLDSSIEFVEPYLKGEKIHYEFVNSKNPNDKLRHPDWAGKPFRPENTSYSKKLEEEIDKYRVSGR